jgi:hypothetical protein
MANKNWFAALLDETQTDNEKEGLCKLLKMIVNIKQQINLRKSFDNDKTKK